MRIISAFVESFIKDIQNVGTKEIIFKIAGFIKISWI